MTVPVTAGTYAGAGLLFGYPYFDRGATYYIWFSIADNKWYMSALLAEKGTAWHEKAAGPHIGTYTPGGTATGNSTVTYA